MTDTPSIDTMLDQAPSPIEIQHFQRRVLEAISNSGLSATTGLSTTPKQSSGTPSNFAVATSDGTVFTLAAGERGFIQNLDSADALAVKLGAAASTTSFSFILKAGSAADDGGGGFVQIDDWIGVVSVATMTGAGRYIAWKVTA